jgi:hypothetical protein
MHFMAFAESFTAEVMCRFLDRPAGHFDDLKTEIPLFSRFT